MAWWWRRTPICRRRAWLAVPSTPRPKRWRTSRFEAGATNIRWPSLISRCGVDVRQLELHIARQADRLRHSSDLGQANKELNEGDLSLDSLQGRLDALVKLHRRIDDKLLRAKISLLRGRLAVGNEQWSQAKRE